jgi:predicted enzyme related to lactoylglutathione lyase
MCEVRKEVERRNPLSSLRDTFPRIEGRKELRGRNDNMNQGIKTIIYPVQNMARAKSLFRELLGVEPYADTPYYVGFRIGDQEIGLDPHGHRDGMTAYYHVDDIGKSLQLFLDSGAEVLQEVKDVGGGRLIASVRDAEGNIIGFLQDPEGKKEV